MIARRVVESYLLRLLTPSLIIAMLLRLAWSVSAISVGRRICKPSAR